MKGEFFHFKQNELFAFSIYFNVYDMFFFKVILKLVRFLPAIVKCISKL